MTDVPGVAPDDAADVYDATVTLPNGAGIHARSAAALVKAAARFQATVTLAVDVRTASARSLMELLRLAARRGASVHVHAEGPDAEAAGRALADMMDRGFGED